MHPNKLWTASFKSTSVLDHLTIMLSLVNLQSTKDENKNKGVLKFYAVLKIYFGFIDRGLLFSPHLNKYLGVTYK